MGIHSDNLRNYSPNYYETILSSKGIYFYGLSLDDGNVLMYHNCIIYFEVTDYTNKKVCRENLTNLWSTFNETTTKEKMEHLVSFLLLEKLNNTSDFFKKYPEYLFAIYYNESCPNFTAWNLTNFDIFTPLWMMSKKDFLAGDSKLASSETYAKVYYCNKYIDKEDLFYLLSCKIEKYLSFINIADCLEYMKRKLDTLMLIGNAKDKVYTSHIYKLSLDGSIKEIIISKKTEN